MKKMLIILSMSMIVFNLNGQNISTREDREALFEYIIEKTKDRESFSPIKEKTMGFDPIEEMYRVKNEVLDASNDTELYYALQKLSAARRDRHLSIDLIEGGLALPALSEGTAPIRFHPDYSSKDETLFFVSDLGGELEKYVKKKSVPVIGDKLLKVNEISLVEYLEKIEPYVRYSTKNNFLRRAAYMMAEKDDNLPPWLFEEELTLELENSAGESYVVTLPYLKDVGWQYGRVVKNYDGYKLDASFKSESFEVYRSIDSSNKTLLLWWYGFRGDLPESTDRLIEYAEKNQLLDYDLIIDAIDSRGGSQGAYALARLTSKPFKTTGGNIKMSDITDDFISGYTARYVARQAQMDGDGREAEDDGTWVMDWLHGPVLKGLAAGQEYSNNVPFKCAHLPHYSDWMMQPAKKHFTGKMVAFFGPWGGSHLSQFASMIIDNDLGHTLGMPDGGYSNTWEWEEDLIFPISGKPVVEFMWSIGHTISPKGGNRGRESFPCG